MTELTNLETKLGEVIGLAMAAQTATERVEKLTKDAKLRKQLKTMRQEAAKAEKDGTAVAASMNGKKSKILAEARTVKTKGATMMKTYLERTSDDLDGFEFLTMAEAGEVGHWGVLQELNKQARHPGVRELVKVQLPIQKRHLKDVLAGSLQLAAKEDANAAALARAGARSVEPLLDESGLGRLLAGRAEGDALAGERDLDFLARLVDPPLDGGERHLERVGDLGVREADDVAKQQRHLQVDAQVLDRTPDGVDRLDPLERRVDDLERRDVLEVDDRPRPALERAQLVEDAVLRHLEEPGREAAPEREVRQPLIDPDEDFLRQILGKRAVADEPKHVVENGKLVGTDDERESSLISSLGLPQDAEIRLGQRQVGRSIAPRSENGRSPLIHSAQVASRHLGRHVQTQKPQGRRR